MHSERIGRGVRLLVIVALLVSLAPTFAPVSVAHAAPPITTANLTCVDFVDGSSVGFAAGSAGTVLKTVNGGASWTTVRSGDTLDFRGISFISATEGWVVTLTGTVVKTTDGGTTWTTVSSDLTGPSYVAERLYDIEFTLPSVGAAVGGAQDTPPLVFRTGTGGNGEWPLELSAGTYEPPLTMPPYPKLGLGEFYAIDHLETGRAFAVGHDRYNGANKPVIWDYDIARGISDRWLARPIVGTGPLYDVTYASTSAAIAVGSAGKTYRTTNAGVTWTAGTVGAVVDMYGITSASASSAWAVGASGGIFRTTDGGATWARVLPAPTGYLLEDVAWVAGTTVVAVGRSGTILRTTDGATWSKVENPAPPQITSFNSPSHPTSTWVSDATVDLAWTVTGTDIEGYGVLLDQQAATVPDELNTSTTLFEADAAHSGIWYAHVRARDALGQWSTTQHISVRVDVDGPVTTFEPDPAGYEGSASVPLSASDAHSGIAQLSYQVDGGSLVTTAVASVDVAVTGPGDHTVTYFAIDHAGNSSALGSKTVSVYVIPPEVPQIVSFDSPSHPAGTWVSTTTVDFSWEASGTDLTGYGLLLDGVAGTQPAEVNTAATSGTRVAAGSGIWYGHVAARDSFGQWSPAAHLAVRVDVTPPTVEFNPAAGGYELSAQIPLDATDAHSGIAQLAYRVGEGALETTVGAGVTVSINEPGRHTVTYYAVDRAGNSSEPVVEEVVVRPEPPAIETLVSPTHPAGTWVRSTSVGLEWAASGTELVGAALELDAVANTVPSTLNVAGDSATRVASGSGTWYGHVRVQDAYGQWSDPGHVEVKVDVNVPAAELLVDPAGYDGSAAIQLKGTDGHSGVSKLAYRIDGGSLVQVESALAMVTLPAPGQYTVSYYATDHAGNVSVAQESQVTVRAFVPEGVPVQDTGRYGTALKAARLAFDIPMDPGPDGHRWVVIASGANWPDALAASGLAGALQGPLILTRPDSIPDVVRDYIIAFGTDRVAIVGGTAAVSANVQAELATLVGGSANVKRYGETTRYATSARIAQETVTAVGRAPWDGVAFLATGGNFPDALAAAPLSAAKGRPLYLAHPLTGVSDETVNAMKAIGVTQVIVLGGTGVVSEASVAKVRLAGITIGAGDRWFGSDRYDTARRIAEKSILEGLTPRSAGLATGENYPDALAGGVAQGLSGSVVMLTKSAVLSPPAQAFFADHKGEIEDLRFFGGTKALSDPVRAAALSAATQ